MEIVSVMDFQVVLVAELTAVQTVLTVFWIIFKFCEISEEILFQMVLVCEEMLFFTAFKISEIVLLILSHVFLFSFLIEL